MIAVRTKEFDDGVLKARDGLLGFALMLARDSVRAEELVQETMMRAMEKHHLFEPGTNLSAWLKTILKNLMFSQHRKRRREVEDPDNIMASNIGINEGQSSACDLKTTIKRMRLLSTDQRRCIELVGVLGFEYEEAAEKLGVPVGTIKSRMNRARTFLETGVEVEESVAGEEADATHAETVSPNPYEIERLYREGMSVSVISEALGGMSKSEVMRLIADLKLPARRK